jgi:hypothetical protein
MQVMTKKKTSKLSSDLLAIISETETYFEVVTYNFFKSTWGQSSRFVKKEQMFKNYE